LRKHWRTACPPNVDNQNLAGRFDKQKSQLREAAIRKSDRRHKPGKAPGGCADLRRQRRAPKENAGNLSRI
jgi:hypothetical protein